MTDSLTASDSVAPEPPAGVRARQIAALSRPRYEVLPLPGTADVVEEHVPVDLAVTVTATPRRGMEPTVALAEGLAMRGYAAVPHVAARLVRDEAHLVDILQRLHEARITDVFVIAGDGAQPVGDFCDSLGLLTAMHRLRRSGATSGLERIGVAGYPEGHPLIGDERLRRALLDKQPLATYVVSQMCFEARTVLGWAAQARATGVRLALHAGVPGVVDHHMLLRVAGRIGVGESTRFLRRHRHGFVRLLRPGGYRPDRLVAQLTRETPDPGGGIAGLHIYTLGDIAATERWRRRTLERLTRGAADG